MTRALAAPMSKSPGTTTVATAHELAALLRRADHLDLAAAADAEAERLSRGVVMIATLGEFKRGKSSLINTLVGLDLLPIGSVPATSVGTRVEFGDRVQATVAFLDGRCLPIAPDAVADYATERGNPRNRRRVASVTITAPAAALRQGLQLVDTPGIGSAFADVTATARNCLADADAALVVLSAEQPASRRELDFLREILATGLPTLVVENKIDLVSAAERREVLDFVSAQVRGLHGAADVPLFAVSSDEARHARRAADSARLAASGVPALETALAEFARLEGCRVLDRGARRRLDQIVGRAVAAQHLRSQTAPLTQFWDEQRLARVRQEINVVLLRDLFGAKERAAAAAADIERSLDAMATESAATRRLETLIDMVPIANREGSVRRWAAELGKRLGHELAALINRWSDAEGDRLSAAVADATAEWRARISESLSPIVGALPSFEFPSADIAPPSIALPASHLDRPLLLPGSVGRRQVRRRARRWLRATVPVLLEARRAGVTRLVAETLERAEAEAHRHLTAALDQRVAPSAPPGNSTQLAEDPVGAELLRVRRRLRGTIDAH